jgi:hypothetical protein
MDYQKAVIRSLALPREAVYGQSMLTGTYRQLWYLQQLRRFNEDLALRYWGVGL